MISLLIVGGCAKMNAEDGEKLEQKNIIIKIIDSKDIEQYYTISIENKGMELKIPTFK